MSRHAPRFLPHEQWLAVVSHAPLVSMDLIVRDAGGRTLLGLRNNEPARGFWFTPGGAIRKNERLDAAYARIAEAELGLPLRRADARLLGVYEHLYDSNFAGAPGIGTHYVVLAYELAAPPTVAELPADQHREWRWLDLPTLLAAADVHDNVKAYFATKDS